VTGKGETESDKTKQIRKWHVSKSRNILWN